MSKPQSRPWSIAEVEEKVPEIVDRLEEAVTDLKNMGIAAAQAEWAYRKAKAVAFVKVTGRNAEEREAKALLHQHQPGQTVADLGLARNLAENAYGNQRQIITVLKTEAELMRTLMVSARGEGQGK